MSTKGRVMQANMLTGAVYQGQSAEGCCQCMTNLIELLVVVFEAEDVHQSLHHVNIDKPKLHRSATHYIRLDGPPLYHQGALLTKRQHMIDIC